MREIKTTAAAIKKAEAMKLVIVASYRDDEKQCTIRNIRCNNCNNITSVQDQTFSRWFKRGVTFCSICNGAVKGVPNSVRVDRLNNRLTAAYSNKVQVVEYLGYRGDKRHGFCLVKFLHCGHTKEYNASTFSAMVKQGKAFKCDTCDDISSKSTMESWSDDILPAEFEKQVPYACIATTDRRWVADYYNKYTNTIIEVTTSGQLNSAIYSSNIVEKEAWCIEHNIKFIVIANLHELEDIVRTP